MTSPYSPLLQNSQASNQKQQQNQNSSIEAISKDDRWHQLYDRYIKPTEGDIRTAKSFNIFGKQLMSPETAHKLRRGPLLAAKGLAKGFGAGGDLLNFAQSVVGIKKPLALAPSSEHMSKAFEYLSGEKVEPVTTGEKILERSASALGSMILTGGNPLLTAPRAMALRPALRTAAAAVAPAGISVHLENAKAPKWLQAASTIGAGLLLHRFQGGNIRSIRDDLFNQANRLAGNRSVPSHDMGRHLNALQVQLNRGGATAAKTAVQGLINDFRGQIQNGRIPVQNLMEFRRNIHERMRDVMNVRGSEIYWNRFRDSIDHGLDQFSRSNPRFGAAYRYANGIQRGIHETHAITRFITRNPLLSGASGAFAKLLMPVAGLPTIGTSLVIGQLGTWTAALAQNPHLRRAYWQVLREAAQRDVRGTLHALNLFNKESDKNEKASQPKKSIRAKSK